MLNAFGVCRGTVSRQLVREPRGRRAGLGERRTLEALAGEIAEHKRPTKAGRGGIVFSPSHLDRRELDFRLAGHKPISRSKPAAEPSHKSKQRGRGPSRGPTSKRSHKRDGKKWHGFKPSGRHATKAPHG